MSKKHFIALADALRSIKPGDDCTAMMAQWRFTVDTLADLCARENSAFNRQRFIGYIMGECGPSGGAVKPARV